MTPCLEHCGKTPLVIVCALVALLLAPTAAAQGDLPDVAPLGAAPRPGAQQAPSDAPETHAAPGGSDSTIAEGNEPSLPEKPLEVSESTLEQIGTDGDPDALGTPEDAKRQFYGLYYNEKAGEYRYRVAFPVWAERTMPSKADPSKKDRASVYGGLYYNRRGAENTDDVLFPVFWNLKNPLEKKRTTVVGPFVNRRTPEQRDDWFLPFYATGRRQVGGYTVIPPLLTSLHRDAKGGLNIVGPAFCSWAGGPGCDTRTAQDIDLGIAPFYFFGQNKKRRYEVVTPLLHYYRYDIRRQSWLNIYGPYFRQHRERYKAHRDIFHVIPFYWSIWGLDHGVKERHTTVAPLFHYGYKGDTNLLITPLFLNKNGQTKESISGVPPTMRTKTFVTWGYARHRGITDLDMITPLYWHHRDPRIGIDRHVFFPFVYVNNSPREETFGLFPLFAYRNRFGISKSYWATPFFNYTSKLQGWSMALNPVLYVGKNGRKSHKILAPLYFDMQSPRSHTTIGFPFFVRTKTPDATHQVILNTYYSERRYGKQKDWQFHFLPLFSYGETPRGHWWNVLFGLTGYTRKGTQSTVRALWVPIPVSQ